MIILPSEANTPLIINAYAVLAFTISAKFFQSVAWWG
jgi:hypothetical protein